MIKGSIKNRKDLEWTDSGNIPERKLRELNREAFGD